MILNCLLEERNKKLTQSPATQQCFLLLQRLIYVVCRVQYTSLYRLSNLIRQNSESEIKKINSKIFKMAIHYFDNDRKLQRDKKIALVVVLAVLSGIILSYILQG